MRKKSLVRQAQRFLEKRFDPARPILLALSGGPDSLALFYVLLACRKSCPALCLHIAHVDHGWRRESKAEAEYLRVLAQRHGCLFHLRTLNSQQVIGNQEAFCREERLKFFSDLCREHHCQAVLLAHHGDDQAETVLKRLFEGAQLPYLCGLQEETRHRDLILWRPFLDVTKKEIADWLGHHSLEAFEDSTNANRRYLRARMRLDLFPLLENHFGKTIRSDLVRIGKEAQEWRRYLENKIGPYLDRLEENGMGLYLDLSAHRSIPSVEVKYLIQKIAKDINNVLSRDIVESMTDALLSGAANQRFSVRECTFYVDRGQLFIFHEEIHLPNDLLMVKCGSWEMGPWQVTITEADDATNGTTSWREAWRGRCCVVLPHDNYTLGMATLNCPLFGKSTVLAKWWNSHKVPAFMRAQVPVVLKQGTVAHEFLTGKQHLSPGSGRKFKIEMTLAIRQESTAGKREAFFASDS